MGALPATTVYEQPALRAAMAAASGATLRPGGLALTDVAIACCALPAGAWVLDVGCGTGTTVDHLRTRYHLNALGLDLSANLLAESREHGAALPLMQADGERLPLCSDQLDAIMAECSLSVLADVDQALAEFRRVLKPGGALMVTDVYARNAEALAALGQWPADTGLSGARSQAQIAEQLRAHGFQIKLWQDHTAALKQLAVQLIFEHGSLPAFWQQTAPAGTAPGMERATAQIKPGYYLLLARKGDA
jgi:SAM-dependent methyltransferase